MLSLALISASALVRSGLDAGLKEFGGFDICLHCATLQQARAQGFGGAQVAIVELAIDLDLGSDDAAAGPPLVLLLARHSHRPEMLRDGLRDGHSLLPGDAPIALIAAAARAAAAGLVSGTPGLLANALADGSRGESKDEQPLEFRFDPLTARENEVLVQMCFGLANREIADTLHISPHTAKFHVAQIIAKLQANSRAHAVAKALRAGLVAA